MDDAVLFHEVAAGGGKAIAVATLNAEKSLNALTLPMIRLLHPQLARWAQDARIAVVVLRGAGDKAFCAGGDVRALRSALLEDDSYPNPQAQAFFTEEYALDYAIHRFPKPIVAWGAGIVMGGGLGLMAGASHRVATAATRIAMPEITIGLYPDVAGSWFLQRMPARVGLFLGLTGAPLNAHDALICNLADHVLPRDGWQAMLSALAAADWSSANLAHGQVSAILERLEENNPDPLPDSPVQRNLLAVHRLMNHGDVAAVCRAIAAVDTSDDWLAAAAASLRHGSPMSAAVTWEIFRRAKHLSLAEVLRMELALSLNFCAQPEFREGVRALLVDKDRQPRWRTASLEEVDADTVARHFHSPWPEEQHPLAQLA